MSFSIRATIRGFVAPKHRLSCARGLWRDGMAELRRRGGGIRESGAFLIGSRKGDKGRIQRFVYYDDLDSRCLDTGIVVFDGSGYGPLWALCRSLKLDVLADIHVHGGLPRQSPLDRDNPMIAVPGHIALIAPDFLDRHPRQGDLGIYEYAGAHEWHDFSGPRAARFFYVGLWG